MALNSTHKDNGTLVYTEDRERLQLMGRQILRRVMNEAIEDLRQLHVEAQNNGEIKSMLANQEDVEKLLFKTVVREIGSGTHDVQD